MDWLWLLTNLYQALILSHFTHLQGTSGLLEVGTFRMRLYGAPVVQLVSTRYSHRIRLYGSLSVLLSKLVVGGKWVGVYMVFSLVRVLVIMRKDRYPVWIISRSDEKLELSSNAREITSQFKMPCAFATSPPAFVSANFIICWWVLRIQ